MLFDFIFKQNTVRYLIFVVVLLLSELARAQTVTLVSGDDYAPYADSKLVDGGMVTELVRQAFAQTQHTVAMEWKPWARGLEEAKRGTYAGTFPYLKNVEREKDFWYSKEIVTIRSSAFVRAGSKPLNFADLTSLVGTTYCLPIGWAPTPALADMVKSGQIKLESPTSISSCAKMVASGRADYFVYGDIQAADAIKNGDVLAGTIVMADFPPLALTPLYLLASKNLPGSEQLLMAFNKGLKAIRKNGLYDKIVKTHSHPHSHPQSHSR